MFKKISSIAFRGIAVAMSVAVIVLNTLGSLSVDTAITLLSMSLATLAINSLQD